MVQTESFRVGFDEVRACAHASVSRSCAYAHRGRGAPHSRRRAVLTAATTTAAADGAAPLARCVGIADYPRVRARATQPACREEHQEETERRPTHQQPDHHLQPLPVFWRLVLLPGGGANRERAERLDQNSEDTPQQCEHGEEPTVACDADRWQKV